MITINLSFQVVAFEIPYLNHMVSINVGVLHYVLDHIYGACMHRTKLSTPFFSRGWGGTKLELFESMLKQLFPATVSQNWPPKMVQPFWKQLWESKHACLKEGIFRTPCDEQLINALPPESHTARIALLTPKSVPPHKMACVVHLAGNCTLSIFSFEIFLFLFFCF